MNCLRLSNLQLQLICGRTGLAKKLVQVFPQHLTGKLNFLATQQFNTMLLLLLLLLLSHFSCVRLCATPQMAAHQAPPSLEFSRQAYWSGLPFPSPMLACRLSRLSSVQLCATLRTTAHKLLCPQDSPGKNTGVGCHFFLQFNTISE